MEDDRLVVLANEIAQLRDRDAETKAQLDFLLATVNRLVDKLPEPEKLVPAESKVPPTDPPRTRTARPAVPAEFDGDRTKGTAFLNSCQTYIRLCPKEFADEQTKIVWAMSYMKAERAAKWTARVFRWEQQPDNKQSTRFLDWADFMEEFRKEFTPAHADALAINRLESSAYYQKTRSLDDYLDEFLDLITESGYTDQKTIVVKFRRGLNSQIQNAVATMAAGRPSDTSPDQWYAMARTVDQNRATNEAFQSAYRAPTRPIGTSVIPVAPVIAPRGHAHMVPTPGNPIPMDLDRNRRKDPLPTLCFRCKKPGHYGRDCPDQFDVRALTTDELQDIIMARMTQLDVVRSDSPVEVSAAAEEGFLPDSE